MDKTFHAAREWPRRKSKFEHSAQTMSFLADFLENGGNAIMPDNTYVNLRSATHDLPPPVN